LVVPRGARSSAFHDATLTDSTVARLNELLGDAFLGCRANHPRAVLDALVVLIVRGEGDQSIRGTARSTRPDDPPFCLLVRRTLIAGRAA
jgi:hypothetical protein